MQFKANSLGQTNEAHGDGWKAKWAGRALRWLGDPLSSGQQHCLSILLIGFASLPFAQLARAPIVHKGQSQGFVLHCFHFLLDIRSRNFLFAFDVPFNKPVVYQTHNFLVHGFKSSLIGNIQGSGQVAQVHEASYLRSPGKRKRNSKSAWATEWVPGQLGQRVKILARRL